MSIYKTRSPLTFTLANMPDTSVDLTNISIYDINLFLFKNPWLAPNARHPGTGDGQPNDILKLSLKTMSDYILKYGITLEDCDLTPITVTTVQQYNSISYTGEYEPACITTYFETGNRPATVRDIFNALSKSTITPVVENLLSANAFDTVNTITPDYLPTVDSALTPTKLVALTDENYSILPVPDFIHVGQDAEYVVGTYTGLLDPKDLTILPAHSHGNTIYNSNLKDNAIKVNGSFNVRNNSRAGGAVVGAGVIYTAVHDFGTVGVPVAKPAGVSAGLSGATSNSINGSFEDSINAAAIQATCLSNTNTVQANYIASEKKVSVRYKARCYKIFKKD